MSAPFGLEELLAALTGGALDAEDLRGRCVRSIERLDPLLHFLAERVEDDDSTGAAPQEPTDGARSPGRTASPAPLNGIPYLTKANIAVRGQHLGCCSRILDGYRSLYDATVTERLRSAGARLLGSSNMDEFAMGSSTENSAQGPTRNPFDLRRTAGGSSGGAAAAVAAGIVPFALGSDTGGSIRQPAGFCGVVGLKPTYGRVSRYGLVAYASSFDQIGPITRSVRDAALVYRELAGADPRDSTCSCREVADPLASIEEGLHGLRIGIPARFLEAQGTDEEIRENLRSIARLLEEAGATLCEVELDSAHWAVAAYYVLATAEASSNLSRYDGVRYGLRVEAETAREMTRRTRSAGFGAEVQLRILLGTYVLSAGYYDEYYRQAQKVRTLIRRDHLAALQDCDLLLWPTSPTTAFELGERIQDPLSMYLSDVFTVTANLTGLPAIAIPSGFDRKGLPLSVQLTGRAFDEATLLRAARNLERQLDLGPERQRRLDEALSGALHEAGDESIREK